MNLEEEIGMRIRGIAALAATAALVVGACSSAGTSGGSPATSAAAPTPVATAVASAAGSAAASAAPSAVAVGEGEGALNLVAWTGYVVGGTGGEQVQGYDWVTPFETETGCKLADDLPGETEEAIIVLFLILQGFGSVLSKQRRHRKSQ